MDMIAIGKLRPADGAKPAARGVPKFDCRSASYIRGPPSAAKIRQTPTAAAKRFMYLLP
jgi:hypothetical protein